MTKYPLLLDRQFLIYKIKNEQQYNAIKLILYAYGYVEAPKKVFFNKYIRKYYYIKVSYGVIYEGCDYHNLKVQKQKTNKILTYDEITQLL